jgi:hypothetical protein
MRSARCCNQGIDHAEPEAAIWGPFVHLVAGGGERRQGSRTCEDEPDGRS